MSTTQSFDDYLEGFRARALERMEAFEKIVEKAHADTVQIAKQTQSNRTKNGDTAATATGPAATVGRQPHMNGRNNTHRSTPAAQRRLVNKGW
ncbi:hypothetical protein C1Y63_05180 [Corynebacterium sp. 13CS0277]|uniref:hypothetical protein n=1 Tax=Corynebacterium sp. 13CS0277 TaxID=2071994 RepID=UPI000D048005|nr:hypothetical protein [Corynebacterium sp. 13CS0277]PRQ11577.1 hypothetical protein C1Y63_05180 [Corynebacterium sp. 13CS0277]